VASNRAALLPGDLAQVDQ